ncbi:DUF4249 domain-containing protein [Mangrovibacterium diazotrophicum]|uniref:Uncharacterized protein DUF4249 n=1 Tax=Mangrovibacterium diazotrophicum TaxID=1261403 RepID=A0A419WAD9_9BACT|nr:DUF4249 domain-containing protein [Mangrovibacterium diazotrophicum]RKD92409.1 uncharacterized protein DUF4249 [Mangrovibacterium diazotrophicum]
MKTRYLLFTLVAFQFLYTACTERVDIDLEEAGDPLLVVFAEITDEPKAQAVYLSRTAPYFDNQELPVVSGAEVYLSDGEKEVQLTESLEEPGMYLTEDGYAGIPGKTYTLRIENVDANEDGVVESYIAESVMNPVPAVDSVSVTYNDRWEGWEVELYAQEPGETEDFYLFKVYKNGELYTDSLQNYWVTDDKFFNGNDIEGPIVQYFDEENDEMVADGDTVMLEMAAITKEYYDFINGVLAEVSTKVPIFSGPSANPEGNISNGALGFFSAQAISRGSTIYKEE